MEHMLADSLTEEGNLDPTGITAKSLFTGVIYPVKLIFYGERFVTEPAYKLPPQAFETQEDGTRIDNFDKSLEFSWYYVVEFWVMPGRGQSFLKFETEAYQRSYDKFRAVNTNDALSICDFDEMNITYPLPTVVKPSMRTGGRSPPTSVMQADKWIDL